MEPDDFHTLLLLVETTNAPSFEGRRCRYLCKATWSLPLRHSQGDIFTPSATFPLAAASFTPGGSRPEQRRHRPEHDIEHKPVLAEKQEQIPVPRLSQIFEDLLGRANDGEPALIDQARRRLGLGPRSVARFRDGLWCVRSLRLEARGGPSPSCGGSTAAAPRSTQRCA